MGEKFNFNFLALCWNPFKISSKIKESSSSHHYLLTRSLVWMENNLRVKFSFFFLRIIVLININFIGKFGLRFLEIFFASKLFQKILTFQRNHQTFLNIYCFFVRIHPPVVIFSKFWEFQVTAFFWTEVESTNLCHCLGWIVFDSITIRRQKKT